MKNKILDVPLHHSFSDFLKKGESITWEGQPLLNTDLSQVRIAKIIFWLSVSANVFYLYFHQRISITTVMVFITSLLFLIGSNIWKRKRKNNFKYALTQKQILFELREKWYKGKTFYAIPFSEIRDVVVVLKYDLEQMQKNAPRDKNHNKATLHKTYMKEGLDKLGTVFLVPHNPQSILFETVDLGNNEKRHQPTLELLEDAEAVAEMIRQGIKNANL